MDLVSYRGPGVAGGVSSGLGTAWRKQSQGKSKWWYLNKGVLEVLSIENSETEKSKFIALLPDSLIQGHYAFCNEFLWPLMHDLPQYASYSAQAHEQYTTFNRLIAEQIDVESAGRQDYFIQDYQLGIVPRWLGLYGHKTSVFWHIPWPKNIPDKFVEPIRELALGLLGASALGFHTEEYADNFMKFVSTQLPAYTVDQARMIIESNEAKLAHSMRQYARAAHKSYVLYQNVPEKARKTGSTKLLVHPLGIDFEYWTELRESSQSTILDPQLLALANSTFVLSVDRVDYTKSVYDRMLIVDKFFEKYPHWQGKVSFVQICGRSRPGLSAFDQYWERCQSLAQKVNSKWQQDDWQPIKWIQQSLSSGELACLYAKAQSMLVNPVRDGLNLTAKEFIACQSDRPGVLLLSPGAGAIHELGEYTLAASPEDHGGTADSIARSLTMPLKERQMRTLRMKTILVSNQLSHWWSTFSNVSRTSATDIHLVGEEEAAVKTSLG